MDMEYVPLSLSPPLPPSQKIQAPSTRTNRYVAPRGIPPPEIFDASLAPLVSPRVSCSAGSSSTDGVDCEFNIFRFVPRYLSSNPKNNWVPSLCSSSCSISWCRIPNISPLLFLFLLHLKLILLRDLICLYSKVR